MSFYDKNCRSFNDQKEAKSRILRKKLHEEQILREVKENNQSLLGNYCEKKVKFLSFHVSNGKLHRKRKSME